MYTNNAFLMLKKYYRTQAVCCVKNKNKNKNNFILHRI